MKISQVLQLFENHGIHKEEDQTNDDGYRTIVVGCRLPVVDCGGGFVYATIVLSPGQDEIGLDEREALKRRLWHLTTDIFGDDPELNGLLDDDEDDPGSHLHPIVSKQ